MQSFCPWGSGCACARGCRIFPQQCHLSHQQPLRTQISLCSPQAGHSSTSDTSEAKPTPELSSCLSSQLWECSRGQRRSVDHSRGWDNTAELLCGFWSTGSWSISAAVPVFAHTGRWQLCLAAAGEPWDPGFPHTLFAQLMVQALE